MMSVSSSLCDGFGDDCRLEGVHIDLATFFPIYSKPSLCSLLFETKDESMVFDTHGRAVL